MRLLALCAKFLEGVEYKDFNFGYILTHMYNSHTGNIYLCSKAGQIQNLYRRLICPTHIKPFAVHRKIAQIKNF